MPCLFCSRVQNDPVRGASLWVVGIRHGEQVLVCPECQGARALDTEFERCPSCTSVKLRLQLGLMVCRGCGWQSGGEEWSV